jgi:hypothetical protein
MPYERPLTEPEYRTLALHRVLVKKLRENPDAFLAKARQNLAFQRSRNDVHSEPYTAAWEKLVNGPQADLEEAMLSFSQVSRDLRPTNPFAGILSDDERLDVLEQVYRDWHPEASPELIESISQMLRGEGRQVRWGGSKEAP